MDDDQFDSFVEFARSYLSHPGLYLDSTAAEGKARAYLLLHRPRDGGDEFLATLIQDSKKNKSAWDALDLVAQDLLHRGDLLPGELAQWTRDVLTDQLAPRGQKRRRPRPSKGSHDTAGRDWNCYFLIDLLIKRWNLRPTCNEISESCSACDVVAVATGISLKTVQRIWTRCSHLMHKA